MRGEKQCSPDGPFGEVGHVEDLLFLDAVVDAAPAGVVDVQAAADYLTLADELTDLAEPGRVLDAAKVDRDVRVVEQAAEIRLTECSLALVGVLPDGHDGNAGRPEIRVHVGQFRPSADVRCLVKHAAHRGGQATVVVRALGLRELERGEAGDRGQARGKRGTGPALRGQQVQRVLTGRERARVEHGPCLTIARLDPVDEVGVGEERAHRLQTAEHAASGFRRQSDDTADATGDLTVAGMVLEDGDRFRVAFVARPLEHVGDGPAAEMCGEQIVGELLGGRAGEEVIAAGLRLAGRVPPAVGDTFRVSDRLDAVDEISIPKGRLCVEGRRYVPGRTPRFAHEDGHAP